MLDYNPFSVCLTDGGYDTFIVVAQISLVTAESKTREIAFSFAEVTEHMALPPFVNGETTN